LHNDAAFFVSKYVFLSCITIDRVCRCCSDIRFDAPGMLRVMVALPSLFPLLLLLSAALFPPIFGGYYIFGIACT